MMKNQLAGLMKQAQQMQENLKRAQEELARTEIEGQAGAGLVKIVMTCRYDVRRVSIDPSLLGEDKDMLEDLVAHTMNDRKTTARVAHEPLSSLDALVAALRTLPSVGPKAAQRMALHLLQHDRDGALRLSQALEHATRSIRNCERCNTFTEDVVCALCRSSKRDATELCIVETPADLMMVEHSQAYSGLYFVLMGRLSPLDGIGPKEIHLDRLLKRATDGIVKEAILATNFTNEGEATAHYIGELLRTRGLAVSRLARGVPVGGELEYVDAGTLAQALRDRRALGA